MNPHGRPWGSEEARRAAQIRWATIRHAYTKAEAVINGRKGGTRSGQVRQAQARVRAVTAALEILRTKGRQGWAEALHLVYARAYLTGTSAVYQRQRRARQKARV